MARLAVGDDFTVVPLSPVPGHLRGGDHRRSGRFIHGRIQGHFQAGRETRQPLLTGLYSPVAIRAFPHLTALSVDSTLATQAVLQEPAMTRLPSLFAFLVLGLALSLPAFGQNLRIEPDPVGDGATIREQGLGGETYRVEPDPVGDGATIRQQGLGGDTYRVEPDPVGDGATIREQGLGGETLRVEPDPVGDGTTIREQGLGGETYRVEPDPVGDGATIRQQGLGGGASRIEPDPVGEGATIQTMP